MKKSPITLLVFATICGSLQAGEMSVSGSGTASHYDKGAAASSASSGWDMNDSLTFAGSGELDNGASVLLSYGTIDNGNIAADEKMTVQIRYSGSFGDLSMGGTSDPIDDVTPTANEETCGWNVRVSHSQYNTGLPDENKVQAGVTCGPAAMSGLSAVLSASYADQFFDSGAEQTVAAGVRYGFYTGIPGMTVGFSAMAGHADTDNGSSNDVVNQDSWEYYRGDLAIGYAVSDNLSVGYGLAYNGSSIDSADDELSTGISASYTYGAMTIGASMKDKTFTDGVRESDDWTSKFALSYAF